MTNPIICLRDSFIDDDVIQWRNTAELHDRRSYISVTT